MPLGYEIALLETFLVSKVAETCNFLWPGASYAHHAGLNKVVGGVLALILGWHVSEDQRISPTIFAREVEIRGDS